MKTLIIYDSVHGNTEKIAKAIGDQIPGDVKIIKPQEAGDLEMGSADLLIIGSPTYGGRPTKPILEFLDKISPDVLKKARFFAFDTRIAAKWVKIFGFASGKITSYLKSKGCSVISEPEGFMVSGTEGPLVEGETVRASNWAKNIVSKIQ
ncbi:MAG: flavodoxin family protein [Actinobacteria bacterium]|nr:flavodoxin family protein [Actinomycetota bacterium]